MMREFSLEQEQQLIAGPRFIEAPGERACPACGCVSVRMYMYRRATGARRARVTYVWCASCRRFKGWTGPDEDGLKFSDPLADLTPEERQEIKHDFESFLRRLDELWESGELPQSFCP